MNFWIYHDNKKKKMLKNLWENETKLHFSVAQFEFLLKIFSKKKKKINGNVSVLKKKNYPSEKYKASNERWNSHTYKNVRNKVEKTESFHCYIRGGSAKREETYKGRGATRKRQLRHKRPV